MMVKVGLVCCLAGLMVSPAVAQDSGAEIYKSKCQECHGEDGQSHTFKGKMSGAANLVDPKVVQAPDADLVTVVKDGKKHMPAFAKKLTDEQIASVVAYVRTLPQPKPAN